MTFDEVLEQVRELLQSKGRVAYRALQRRFTLDDEYLEDLKAELIDAEHVAVDEDNKVLVWVGNSSLESRVQSLESEKVQSPRSKVQSQETQPLAPSTQKPNAVNLRSCSVTSSARLPSPLGSTRKSCARWCVRIKKPVLK